jgi:hypothetical protein
MVTFVKGHRARPGIIAAMKRSLFVFFVWLLAGASQAEDTWYVQRITSGDTPIHVENFWSKGSRMRAETVVAGRPILTLVNGEFYYVIDRLTGSGVAIRRAPRAIQDDARQTRPFAREAEQLIRDGGEKVSSDALHGRPCDVYRLTDRTGRREACIDPEPPHLPRSFEQFDRGTGRRAEIRYIDWLYGFSVPDPFFQPDPRVELEHVDYQDYLDRSRKQPVGPAPVFFRELLHGTGR